MARRQLADLRVIVTGCSSGIGRALVVELAKNGAKVVATARRIQRLQSLQQECQSFGGEVVTCAGDITESKTRDNVVGAASDSFGGLDALINNAGVGSFGPFHQGSSEQFAQLINVNLLAAAELTRMAVPFLTESRDPIVVNIGSVLGNFPVPLKAEYCASKFALRGLSEAMRMEFRPLGIDLLLVSPSTTESEFFEQALDDRTDINWLRYGSMTSEQVAVATIRAIEKRKKELVLSSGGKLLSLLYRYAPSIARRVLAKDAQHIRQLSKSKVNDSPDSKP